jgi:hypothetical protein
MPHATKKKNVTIPTKMLEQSVKRIAGYNSGVTSEL